jgi:hypothetical protein
LLSRPQVRLRSQDDLSARRQRHHGCWDHLIVAPLWPLHGLNLGTLLRTCDADGACMAVPRLPWVPEAPSPRQHVAQSCVCALDWPRCGRLASRATHRRIAHRRRRTCRRSDRVRRSTGGPGRTVAVLGHEQSGIPADALDLIDLFVEIPMVGIGASLNVAVAGSLVLYRLAGLL